MAPARCRRRRAGRAILGALRATSATIGADGLICDLSLTCQPPGTDGVRCTSKEHCAAGLICNHGYVPEDSHLGECHPPGSNGQPCAYARYDATRVSSSGCDSSTACTPHAPTHEELTTVLDTSKCTASGENPSCGFPGVCTAQHLGGEGEPCLGSPNCQDGLQCYQVVAPRAPDGTMGFDCHSGTAIDCFEGPWPGICGMPGLPTRSGDCTATACAPGHLCDIDGKCQPRWFGVAFDRCGEYMTSAPNDDFCGATLHCVDAVAPQPPRCMPF